MRETRTRTRVLVAAVILVGIVLTSAVGEEVVFEPRPTGEEARCVHDHATHFGANGKRVVSRVAETVDVAAPGAAAGPVGSGEEAEVGSGAHGKSRMGTRAVTGPLRILFDTSLFANDETTRVCDADGAQYQIGTPAVATDNCNSTLFVNCFSTCTPAMLWPQEKADFMVNEVLPAVEAKLGAALSVISPAASVAFSATSGTDCGADDYGPATIPQSYFDTPTTTADLIIFVTRRPMLGGAQAVGVECYQDARGRPLAGHVNVAPQYVNPADLQGTVDVVLHETIHVLGFSFAKFFSYLNEFGKLYSSESPPRSVVATVSTDRGNTIRKLNTPRVTAVARQHFDCASGSGLELEDGGGIGIFKSHWEKRIMMNEIMTGRYESIPPPALSVLTLAAFEDSGWYIANYEQADPLNYGFRQGCDFFSGACSSWKGDGYFCNDTQIPSCNFDRSAKAECIVTEWAIVPSAFQYFNNPTTGGYSDLADFCPIYTPVANGACSDASNGATPSPAAEQFGSDSKCFISTIRNTSLTYTGAREPRCYRHSCSGDETTGYTLSISVGGSSFTECPPRGGSIDIPGFQGSVVCPAASDVCRVPSIIRPPIPRGASSFLAPSFLSILFALFFVLCFTTTNL